jgi:hypothetical protein
MPPYTFPALGQQQEHDQASASETEISDDARRETISAAAVYSNILLQQCSRDNQNIASAEYYGSIVLTSKGLVFVPVKRSASNHNIKIGWESLWKLKITKSTSPKHLLRLTTYMGESFMFVVQDRESLEKIELDILSRKTRYDQEKGALSFYSGMGSSRELRRTH